MCGDCRPAGGRLLPILPLLNAADAMSRTIILDRQGVVVYNAQAPLTYEKLEVLYRQALEH